MQRTPILRATAATLFVVLAAAALLGLCDPVLRWAQEHPLGHRAEAHLDASLRRATIGFMTVSTIKAGLAVLEGSELTAGFGVGASIEAGDLVQPVYDYVDVAWRTLFLATVSLMALKVLLSAAIEVGAVVLALLLLAMAWIVRPRRTIATRTRPTNTLAFARALAVTLAILVYVLPGAILGGAHLSSAITSSLLAEAQEELDAVEQVLEPVSGDRGGFVERMRQARDALTTVVENLRDRSESLFRATLRLIVGYLFDCVLFPLALVVIGTRATRWAVELGFAGRSPAAGPGGG